MLIEISSFKDAHDKLRNITEPVQVTNAQGTIYTLGIRGVHYLFDTLKQEFGNITHAIVLVDSSTPAFFAALSLRYTEIIYTGSLMAINDIAKKYKVRLYSYPEFEAQYYHYLKT